MAEAQQAEATDGDSPEDSTDFTKSLKDVGLQPQKWIKLFSKHLGLESMQSLKHVGPEDYQKIEKYAEYPWEKQALRKVLNIPHDQPSLKEIQSEQEKKNTDNETKGKTQLEDVKKLNLKARGNIEKIVKGEAGSLKKAKNTTTASSKPLMESLEAKMDKYEQGLTTKEKRPLNTTELSDKDILLNASGGLALEGIYVTLNQEDVLQKREHLLNVPTAFTITGPQKKPVLEEKEFSSFEAETKFHKSVEKLGLSIATSVKGGFWCIQAEGSVSYNSTSKTKQKRETDSEHSYISTTKYNYIPMASSYITKDQLRLSSPALEELKTIEEVLEVCSEADKPNVLREKYENFFSRFGSHANQGPLHFGGIFWWTAACRGFKQEKLEEVKKETQEVIDSSVSVSYSGAWSLSATNDVTKTDTKKTCDKVKNKTVHREIQLTVTKTGGPVTVDSLSEWKSGLEANKKTWSVIDRGFHLTPVWEILLHAHKENFRDVYQVALDLKNIYVAITGQHLSLPLAENVSTAMYEANSLLSELPSWNVEPAQQQLQILADFKQRLSDKTGNYNVWLNVCLPHEALHSFLQKVMDSYKQNTKADDPFIRSLLKYLLQNLQLANKNLDSYSAIIRWLHPEKEETPIYSIEDFQTFLNFMSKAKNDLLQLSSDADPEGGDHDDPKEGGHDAQVKVNVLINSYVGSFLKNLRNMGKKEEEMIVLCAASHVGYSAHKHFFQQRLGWQEVDFMVNDMQHLLKEYNSLKELGACRTQALLLEAALTGDVESCRRSTEQKRELLQLMVEKLKSCLKQEIENVLQKHKDVSDLQSLIEDLKHLRSGDYEVINEESLAKEIKNVCLITNQTEPSHPNSTEKSSVTFKQDVKNLLISLGLEKYFPKGLTRRNFHVVYTSLPKSPGGESDLPLYFMQMLMKLDYRFRYLIYKGNNQMDSRDKTSSNDDVDTFDSIDDLLSFCSEEEVTAISDKKENIHPIDLFMAMYHCADDFMRQYTFTKLSVCQFALPFLVPRPYDSEIEFPLWAFRQIQKSVLDFCFSETGTLKEKLICQVAVPFISFTRFGSYQFSKSQLLTNLLSKHKHDIFYHRNCKGSVKNRVLTNGMAEIFWFCPSGKDTDQFPQTAAFVNLRGDIQEHEKQSVFLHEISSINVIVYSKVHAGHEMSTMKLKNKPLIILSPDRETSVHVNTNSMQVIIGLKNQNEAKVLEELTFSIRRFLAAFPKSCSLETCAEVGRRNYGFHVDEDSKECSEGKAEAQKMMALLKQNDLRTAKEKLLPISGSLWHSWCEKDRELNNLQNKMDRSIEHHRSQTEKEKNSIRIEQLKKTSKNKFMKDFITLQTSLPKATKQFFLQWFKIFLDDLSCELMSHQRLEYIRIWNDLQSKQMDNKAPDRRLQDDLDSLSKQMNASIFGLEHILREVGQTYETLHDLQHKDECFDKLPKIAADMMVHDGYPIELMDGDACYVPINWIKAVLTEVIKMIGDRNMFVLSVLGVQSSGKSTLLNTMFGLQFGVSAGRCTRGAFMQLMEIADELKNELGFDYILVIDTEGLRAMELANRSTTNHDNELATFVIGVGNMTLINVFGENPTEIKDILQIAVQAFLRMKQVKLSTSCLFVHQNVEEVTARDKNADGRRALQTELDKMTALAAEQEMCHIQRFSDVISFDANRHIYYFSHLWEGNPPMAPPNPHYSENTQKVKDMILFSRKADSGGTLSISEVSVRIEDLWMALKDENFVFSFKNTLEISAYRKVENNFRKHTWQLRRHFLELQAELNNKIKKGEVNTVSQRDIESRVGEKFESILREFDIFFNEDKDKEILIQWKGNIQQRLMSLQKVLVEETRRQATERIQLKKSQNQVNQRQLGYEEELRKKSKQLALDLKDQGLEESQLKDNFNVLWQEWVTEISTTSPKPEEPNIYEDAEDVLFQYYREECSKSKKLKAISLWTEFSVDLSNHAQKKGLCTILGSSDKRIIEQMFQNLHKVITRHLNDKVRLKVDYNKAFFYEIIQEITDHINEKKFNNFTLTKMFNFHLSLYFFGLAAHTFQAMHLVFNHANNPVVILESKREEFFNCFKISCEGAASIKTFADSLCKKILEAMQPALYKETVLKIVDEMTSNYPPFATSRSRLETYILIYLAEEEDFEKYRQYLHFPKTFFQNFIETSVNNYYGEGQPRSLQDVLHINLDRFQKLVLSGIAMSTRIVKDKKGKVSDWLDEFYKRIEKHVTFARDDLKSIEHLEIQDIEFIQEAMCASWNEAIEEFKKDFNTTTFDSFETKPHEILAKQLSGCWEQCPFCGAICTNTIANHDGNHTVTLHRPQALTGISWIHSNEFVIEICSTLVSSHDCLVLDNNTQILYRNYRDIGPNYASWSIMSESSSQPYWKWFVHTFQKKLEDDYKLEFKRRGAIPEEWSHIDKKEIIAKLKEQL